MSDLSPALNALRRSHTQLPVSVYFDESLHKQELERIFQSGPRYLGHALSGHRADLERLPPPPGRHAARPRQHRHNIVCPLHRWTYDLKGELIGAPHFADDPCLNLNNYAVQTGTACCSRQRPRRRRGLAGRCSPASARRGPRLHRLRARQGRTARVQLQLEDLHRGLPRGLPRRPVPPGPRPVRHLRRPALGVRPRLLRADRGREPRAWAKPGSRRRTSKWHDAVLASATAYPTCRSTARSG
jgi:hypothetical protein